MWLDDEEQENAVPDDIIDVNYRLIGRTMPVEYSFSLAAQLRALAPWLDDEAIGINLVIAGEEGNGWYREQNPEEIIYLARRTRLTLRMPKQLVQHAPSLNQQKIDLHGHNIEIGTHDTRLLSDLGTLYARHIAFDETDENDFVARIVDVLRDMDVRCKKILCGKARLITTPDSNIHTRSVMLADLSKEDSIKIQQQGVGPHRKLGCGFFVPHKSV